MQSETGFPSSHQLKSYVASKSRLKLAARCPVSGCWPSCICRLSPARTHLLDMDVNHEAQRGRVPQWGRSRKSSPFFSKKIPGRGLSRNSIPSEKKSFSLWASQSPDLLPVDPTPHPNQTFWTRLCVGQNSGQLYSASAAAREG